MFKAKYVSKNYNNMFNFYIEGFGGCFRGTATNNTNEYLLTGGGRQFLAVFSGLLWDAPRSVTCYEK